MAVGGAAVAMVLGCWLLTGEAVGRAAEAARGRIGAGGPGPATAADRSSDPGPGPVTRVYRLRQAQADRVVRILTGVLDEMQASATAGPDEAGNSIIVTASPDAHGVLEGLIQSLDVARERRAAVLERQDVPAEVAPAGVQMAYRLRYAKADALSAAIQRMFDQAGSGVRIVADERGNTVLVSGPSEIQERVSELIQLLDTPVDRPARLLRIFRLTHAGAEDTAMILHEMFAAEDLNVSVDHRTNSLVVSADESLLGEIEAVLPELDTFAAEPAEQARGRTYQVRIVWLAAGPSDLLIADAEPAADLGEVISELTQIGVENVEQVGQVIVNSASEGSFSAACSPLWFGAPADLKVSGRLRELPGMASLEISIDAHQTRVESTEAGRVSRAVTLAHLQTGMAAPLGHHVVLGITPMEKTTSVFVVQITPSN
jgi:hypothetical protein